MIPRYWTLGLRLMDIASMLFMIENFGTPEDILEANRKVHMPRIGPALDKILDEVWVATQRKNNFCGFGRLLV